MFKRYVFPILSCVAATLVIWLILEKSHPVFSTAALESKAREMGGMSAEMIEEYRGLMFKSNSISFGIWGAVLAGLTGMLANPLSQSRWKGMLVGMLLGALGGALGAYLGQLQEARSEYQGASATYWVMRWAALTVPMALASAIACAIGGNLPKQLGDCLAGAVIGMVLGILLITLLHGVVTPLEKPENIVPAWSANRALALFAVNLSIFTLICSQVNRSTKAQAA
jgi:hypothetical protein